MEHKKEDCKCQGKTCIKCNTLLCLYCYAPRKKGSRDGRRNTCHGCINIYQGTYTKKNPKPRRIENYYEKYGRKRDIEHSEERKEYKRIWRENHREHIRKQKKEWDIVNPEKNHALGQKGNLIRRQRIKEAGDSFTYKEWRQVVEKYEFACLCCGKKEPEITLSPDHVIPLSRGGTNSIANIQPLCLTCNKRKSTKNTDYRPK